MKLLRFLFRQAPLSLIFAILAGFAGGLASTGLLVVINQMLESELQIQSFELFLVFIALCLAVPATRILSSFLLIRLGEEAIMRQRLEMSRRVLATSLQRLEKLRKHRILTALTSDVQALSNALITMPIVCTNAAILAGCLGYLLWISRPVFIALAGAMLLGSFAYRLAISAGVRRFRLARDERDNLMGRIRALTEAVSGLKLHFPRRQAFLDSLKEVSRKLRHLNLSSMTIFASAASIGQVLFFAAIGVLLYFGPQLEMVDQSQLVKYTITLLYVMTPLQLLLNSFADLGRAEVAMRKLEELGLSLLKPTKLTEPRLLGGESRLQALELVGVSHTYKSDNADDEFTLGPIDLSLKPGEMVFLIGGNGSGKTTLAKLVAGLYLPQLGEIYLNGELLTKGNEEDYWQYFTMISSDFFLFDSLLGLEIPSLDEHARDYLKKLHLDHKVRVDGGKFSTTDLSQGQRKRLALLTAYLEDRPIYVFDEWAADQDPIFKQVFYRQLLPELKAKGKAILVISHDDRYFDVGDRVLKLVDGQLTSTAVSGGFLSVDQGCDTAVETAS